MQIVAALFIDDIDVRSVPGPSTRIDLGGVQFSAPAPTPLPLTWAPHLVVIVHAPDDSSGSGVLEVVYKRDGEQIARNVQPLQIEPGSSTTGWSEARSTFRSTARSRPTVEWVPTG